MNYVLLEDEMVQPPLHPISPVQCTLLFTIHQICNVLASSKDIQELKFIFLPLIDGNI